MTTEVTVETDEQEQEAPDVIVINNDDGGNEVQEATTIVLVDRLARVEEHQTLMAEAINAIDARIGAMQVTDELQQEEIETVAEATTELAADVPEIAEDVADTTTAKPDEAPKSKENWYYRKWFGRS